MQSVDKYNNIQNELPKLQKVLLDAIQSEFLEIQSIQLSCDKYQKACHINKELARARFVVYSKYIKKSEHKYEEFVFLDHEGQKVCHVSGKDMELYGMLSPITLELSQEYQINHFVLKHHQDNRSRHLH